MVILTVIEKGREKQYLVPHSLITVGRAADNVIEIKDAKSSRRHCEIRKTGETYHIRDLDSHNGTLVNGVAIHEAELNPGDRINIGLTTILFDVKPEIDEKQDEQTTLLGYYGTLRHRDNLQKLLEVSLAVTRQLDLKKLLETILDGAIEVTGAERGFIIIEEDEAMKVKVARNIRKEEIAKARQEISLSIIKEVRKKGVPVISDSAVDDKRFREAASVHGLNLRSIICIPLKARDEMLGLVYLDNRFESGAFADADLRILQAFCNHASTALENARLYERLRRQSERLAEVNRELEGTVAEQTRELAIVEKGAPAARPLKYDYGSIVGRSEPMLDVLRLLDRITDSLVPVLIQGDSGTGKELVARAIHFNGPLKKQKFVTENCAAVPDTLLESELFGYVKGSFTGADRDRKGLFEIADGGTLFLDEVADMSPEMQSKLLRAVDKGEIRPVGGKETRKVKVRIIAATNKDLKKRVEQNLFREDLYYRLNVVRVNLPPLRKRREDIPLLIDHFLTKTAKENKEGKRRIDRKCIALMTEYDWPGNVRELENEIRRLVALSRDTITPPLLSEAIREGGPHAGVPAADIDDVEHSGLKAVVQRAVAAVEKDAIEKMLAKSGGKKIETARRLGISRPTLDAKIEAYDIKLD
ncbi:MAG: sigma-54-dependent Fis family transcriptional regulator [Planctomycetota bacterium]|nr:MAG: sigma-54-dependent Fis family transcriptional regulator [Planctomycetota bacterium]